MRVAIYGSYNGTSVGDTAILLGLLRAISQFSPKTEVTVLTHGPIDLSRDLRLCRLEKPPRLVRSNTLAAAEWPVSRALWWRLGQLGLTPKTKINTARCRAVLSQQDMLIIGGGNLLMDLFEYHVETLEKLIEAARAVGVPYFVAGVGAGPISDQAAAQRLGAMLAGALKVAVRDEESRKLCVELLGHVATEVAPDLAFGLGFQNQAKRPLRRELAVNVAAIGAPTWPYHDPQGYQRYLAGMLRLVKLAVEQTQPAGLSLVTSNPAVDQSAAQDLKAMLSQEISIPTRHVASRDVTEALSAFAGADLAITTRLHAGVLAALAGCRVLPVAYQPKVSSVLVARGIANGTISLTELEGSDLDIISAIQNLPKRMHGAPETGVNKLVGEMMNAAESAHLKSSTA